MNKKKKVAVAILLVLAIVLIGVVSLRTTANAEETLLPSSVYAERLEKIHWVADALRSLGFENGSEIQKAALAQCGHYWHEQYNLRQQVLKKEEAEKPKLEPLGEWTLTAYCNDGRSASGMANVPGQTCACNCLPFGTRIYVEGMGEYVVTDRGASSGQWAWHNSNWADLYMSSSGECNSWGVQHRQVYKVVG